MPAKRETKDDDLATNQAMARIMNQHFGKGNWVHDKQDDVWMTPCTSYSGKGRRYIALCRDGGSMIVTIPAGMVH